MSGKYTMDKERLDKLINNFNNELPQFWDRRETPRLTYGLISERMLREHARKGTGPEGIFRVSYKHVRVEKEGFLAWLKQLIAQKNCIEL